MEDVVLEEVRSRRSNPKGGKCGGEFVVDGFYVGELLVVLACQVVHLVVGAIVVGVQYEVQDGGGGSAK